MPFRNLQYLFILTIATCLFSCVPAPNEKNTFQVDGIISKVHSPCCYDIVFRLENDETGYYINRGLERGFIIADLEKELLNEHVEITVIKTMWNKLGKSAGPDPIARIRKGEAVIFNRMSS